MVVSAAMGRQRNEYGPGEWNPLSLGQPRR